MAQRSDFDVELGWEPQFLLIKNATSTGGAGRNWQVYWTQCEASVDTGTSASLSS